MFATIHSVPHSGFVDCLTVGVRRVSGGSFVCRCGRSVVICATMKGSADSVFISANGRFVARTKVIFTVKPGGA